MPVSISGHMLSLLVIFDRVSCAIWRWRRGCGGSVMARDRSHTNGSQLLRTILNNQLICLGIRYEFVSIRIRITPYIWIACAVHT
jgi:hypothetical protein